MIEIEEGTVKIGDFIVKLLDDGTLYISSTPNITIAAMHQGSLDEDVNAFMIVTRAEMIGSPEEEMWQAFKADMPELAKQVVDLQHQ